MSKLQSLAAVALLVCSAHGAQAGTISDNYIGAGGAADSFGVVANSIYEIQSAVITRVGTVLKIAITTNFANKTSGTSLATGVGYGDLFLSKVWTPDGTSANGYATDSSTNGTLWKYGVVLSDGGRFQNGAPNASSAVSLYALNGTTNGANISPTVGTSTVRGNQENLVNTSSSTTKLITTANATSNFVSLSTNLITFSIDVSGTELANSVGVAMHWGATNQADVLEGFTTVPEPGSVALFGLAAAALVAMRRRKHGVPALA